jgi:hypothetical protein
MGQTMLTIGAIMLLGVTVLNTNRSSLQHGAIIAVTEVGIYASSLAQAKIEEAESKAFDEFSASDTLGSGDVITDLTQLATTLGRETGEVYPDDGVHPRFDDFDDYNYYSGNNPYRLYVPGVDTFRIQTTVFYVDTANPQAAAGTRTWHKKMIVKVWPTVTPWGEDKAQSRPDTVTMSYIYSYWWFR